jgi:hypothetical protein
MSTITTINAGDQITSSRTDINTNFSNLNTDKIETSAIDTDTTLAANSDSKIPSQKAVKTYVDAGGNVNATTTNKGIVEISTQGEYDAGTVIGATGATLVPTVALIKAGTNPIIRKYLNADSPATWTKPTGLKYLMVELVGGGGGGGGADVAGGGAGGGGGGGYSRKIIAVASLGSTETVTIGAGGLGAGSGGQGGTGGTSSFGSHLSATGGGGGGGNLNNANTFTAGGDGGVGSSGDINIAGGDGFACLGATDGVDAGGHGGSSYFGGGARELTGNQTGKDGVCYGSGGSGGSDDDGASSGNNGGAGATGVVIVTEYYS